jgi:recombination protein RecA
MKEKKGNDIDVALENLEKGLGNKDGRPKIQLFSSYIDKNNRMDIEVIPFGIKSVDDATNMGGVPRGRMIELFGPESGGKSYLTLKLMASAQKMGLKAALIDIEHSFVQKWASENGVDVPNFLYGADFDYGEQALEYVGKLCESGLVALVVIDSTAALIPKAEIDGDIIDSNPGLLARMMSKAVRKIMDSSSKTGTTVVWVNQIREKLSINKPAWGDSETTPGGKALKFYSHMRLRVVRVGKVFEKGATEDDKSVVATTSKIKVIKNKVAAPFGEGEFEIQFNEGANNPVVNLVKNAYEIKAIGRKNIEEKMTYVFGKGKDQEVTGCTDFLSLAEWFVKNNKVLELIGVMKEKAEEKGITLSEEILSMEIIDAALNGAPDNAAIPEEAKAIIPEEKE